MEDICIKRLDILKNEMILNNSETIDLNNTYEFYDSLLRKTFSGDFDNLFLSKYLYDLSKEEIQEIMNLTKKYNSLCFYKGNIDNWLDSIEGVSLSDVDLVSIKLLDNYDYLIGLAKNGGENTLMFLNKFQNSEMFNNGSVVALLRSRFDDNILTDILIEMANNNGKYKDFTNTQKIVMCDSPGGVLYRRNEEGNMELVPVDDLKESIFKAYDDNNNDYSIKDIDSESFTNIISSIESDYYGAIYKKQ